MEWINYSRENEISVSTPIQSLEGNEYELVKNDEDLFIVVAFTQAIGFAIGEQPWTEEAEQNGFFFYAFITFVDNQYP